MNKNITIESWTNYSMLLRKQKNVCFNAIRNLATTFIKNLSQEDQNELFDKMSRGVLPLGSEPEMSMYMYAYGKMHYMKLMRAFENMDNSIFDTDLEIIDYGCGQAMGIIALADYLKSRKYTPKIKSITLIEPSKLTLNRAVLHTTVLFPDIQIITINKVLDNLVQDDFKTETENSKLHIFSNILDVESFDLGRLADVVDNSFCSYNAYLCVSPFFCNNDKRSIRVEHFRHYFQNTQFDYAEDLGKYEWVEGWTSSVRLFHKGELNRLQFLATKTIAQFKLEKSIPSEVKLYIHEVENFHNSEKSFGLYRSDTDEFLCDISKKIRIRSMTVKQFMTEQNCTEVVAKENPKKLGSFIMCNENESVIGVVSAEITNGLDKPVVSELTNRNRTCLLLHNKDKIDLAFVFDRPVISDVIETSTDRGFTLIHEKGEGGTRTTASF